MAKDHDDPLDVPYFLTPKSKTIKLFSYLSNCLRQPEILSRDHHLCVTLKVADMLSIFKGSKASCHKGAKF